MSKLIQTERDRQKGICHRDRGKNLAGVFDEADLEEYPSQLVCGMECSRLDGKELEG